MHEEEIIKQLRAENEQLKREIELLKEYIGTIELVSDVGRAHSIT